MGISIIGGGGSGGGGGSSTVPDYDTYLNAVYEMNDSTGSTMEDAHGSFDLTKQAGTPTFGATGINGDAITQDSTSYFTRAFGGGFGFGTEDFLISLWFSAPSTGSRSLFSLNNDPTVTASNSIGVRLLNSLSQHYVALHSLGSFISGIYPLMSLSTFHNVILAVRRTSNADEPTSRLYIFVDGICGQYTGVSAAVDFSSRTLSIGRSGSIQSSGISFDQVRVYKGTDMFSTRNDLSRFALDMWNDGTGYFDWS